MLRALRRRYLDILGSIYIYNEHRGYTGIDRVLAAVQLRYPHESAFIRSIEKHRADERQHYLMFRRYFELLGCKPYAVDKTCGHIDRFIRLAFRCDIDDLDTATVIENDELFYRLCRVIMLTEMRGMRQVDILLRSSILKAERLLLKIFRKIEKDEPSHWQPYQRWLELNNVRMPNAREKLTDWWVHQSLLLFKLPVLFLNPFLPRRCEWYDEERGAARAYASSEGSTLLISRLRWKRRVV